MPLANMPVTEGRDDLARRRRVADNSVMIDQFSATSQGDIVYAAINYLGACKGKPRFHAQEPGRDSWSPEPHRMAIENMRVWDNPPSLVREGVTVMRHQSVVRDFDDPDEIARVYLPELERLLLEWTGAAQIVMLPKAVPRYSARSPRYRTGENSRPALFAHIDRTPKTAPGLGVDHFGAQAIELKPGQRLAGFNLWRALSGPPQDTPLAVCDARSVAADDLVKADGVYDYGPEPWTTSEAYMLRFNPQHRWLYFKDMRPDELMIFRAYNWGPKSQSGFTPGVPHSAFEDPTLPLEAPARVSIEARAFAVFDV